MNRRGFLKKSGLLQSIWPYRLVRWLVAAVFLWAGVMKLSDPQAFAVIIGDFGLAPDALVGPISLALPILEIIAAIGLVFDTPGSLTVVAGLLVFFIAILAYGLWLGLAVDCGCFGPADPEALAYRGLGPTLSRDLLLATGVLFLYWWRCKKRRAPGVM